ncbi:FAD binding domain-containing protein, partial [Modestobacter versicolor]|uniref:FAD binding domain-containing protein n=1 Tax=Modestobacter versicolor TaxID=429133 RepID=UPI0021AC5855
MATRRSAPGSRRRRLRIALLPAPGQSLGLAALVAVLAAALVSVPLVLGSAEQGAWAEQRRGLTETQIGATLYSAAKPPDVEGTALAPGSADVQTVPAGPLDLVPRLDAAVTQAALDTRTGVPVALTRLRVPLFTPSRASFVSRAQLLHRDGAAEHVEVVAGSADDRGVLLPQRLADDLGLGPGDTWTAESADGLPTALPVAGVYADLGTPLPAWWEGQRELFAPRAEPRFGQITTMPSPPVVIADRDVVLAAAGDVAQDVFLQWFLPLAEGIGVGGARDAAAQLDQLGTVLSDPARPVAQLVADADFPAPRPTSQLAASLDTVDDTVALLRPQVRAVGTGAGVAAGVLVGAWAGWRVRRRADELASLVARGVSPLSSVVKILAGGQSLIPVMRLRLAAPETVVDLTRVEGLRGVREEGDQ